MELSSCPQCTTRRNIPISFSFFLTNRFHLVLSCKHCNVRYVPTMLQRIVQLILMLALAHWLPLRILPWRKLESTAAFHRGRSVAFFIISLVVSFVVTMVIAYLSVPEALISARY